MQKNRELIKTEYLAKHGEEIKFTDIAKEAGARRGPQVEGRALAVPQPTALASCGGPSRLL